MKYSTIALIAALILAIVVISRRAKKEPYAVPDPENSNSGYFDKGLNATYENAHQLFRTVLKYRKTDQVKTILVMSQMNRKYITVALELLKPNTSESYHKTLKRKTVHVLLSAPAGKANVRDFYARLGHVFRNSTYKTNLVGGRSRTAIKLARSDM